MHGVTVSGKNFKIIEACMGMIDFDESDCGFN